MEAKYYATERECYAVVWAVTILRSYIAGTTLTLRTDYDSLNWPLSLVESSGRLTSWILRLLRLDFQVHSRPRRVHQALDALSRLLQPQFSADAQ